MTWPLRRVAGLAPAACRQPVREAPCCRPPTAPGRPRMPEERGQRAPALPGTPGEDLAAPSWLTVVAGPRGASPCPPSTSLPSPVLGCEQLRCSVFAHVASRRVPSPLSHRIPAPKPFLLGTGPVSEPVTGWERGLSIPGVLHQPSGSLPNGEETAPDPPGSATHARASAFPLGARRPRETGRSR